jgi:trigger factor
MKIANILVALSLLASTSDAFVPNRVAFARAPLAAPLHASKLERLPESNVRVTFTVPGSATKAAYDKACMELSKNIIIPGFRKGAKIPPQVLEQNMSGKGGRYALRAQAINSLISELIEPALKEEHGLEPIGQPSLETPAEEMAKDFKPGEDLELFVRCDVWPDIQWKKVEGKEKPYIGLGGSYKRKPFDDFKMNKALTDLRERYATLEPIDDASHILDMGDACVVNMEGYMATEGGEKGEPLPNAASGDRVEVIMGTGRYMTGLVEGLVGAKIGDTKIVTVTFPDALRDKSLAGKKALFDVTVLEASKRTLPEVTDEFANNVRAGLTAESLREELRKAVDSEDAKEFAPARNAALAKALAEVMDVDVPDTLVTGQAREKFAMMMSDMRNSGVADEEIKKQINPENFLKYKKIVKDDIVKDFKVSMAVDEIGRMEGIEVPDSQVEEQMEAIKQEAQESKEDIDETQIRSRVEATLQRECVMDFLAENGNLELQFTDDDEEFDEELMAKLAEESLAREESLALEQEMAAAAEGEAAAAEEASS